MKLRDCELGATLNRELKLRVRPVNGLTCHKQVVRQDIRIAAKVIKSLDEKWKMWDEQEGEEKKDIEKEVLMYFVFFPSTAKCGSHDLENSRLWHVKQYTTYGEGYE